MNGDWSQPTAAEFEHYQAGRAFGQKEFIQRLLTTHGQLVGFAAQPNGEVLIEFTQCVIKMQYAAQAIVFLTLLLPAEEHAALWKKLLP